MEEKVIRFLVDNNGMNEYFAGKFVNNLKKHEDIYAELCEFAETEEYKDGAKSGEWTAKALHEKLPNLKPQIIFEILAGLRDKPEDFEKYIAESAIYL
jgi:hypothetical protein